ncbi:MAG: hypothetical protein Q8N63_09180, partial [Nanoarchaeota archaeon]|nr:hypothetical protein [Nanoarchaeota archaeon]
SPNRTSKAIKQTECPVFSPFLEISVPLTASDLPYPIRTASTDAEEVLPNHSKLSYKIIEILLFKLLS